MFDEINEIVDNRERYIDAKKAIINILSTNIERIITGDYNCICELLDNTESTLKFIKNKYNLSDEDIRKIKRDAFNDFITEISNDIE